MEVLEVEGSFDAVPNIVLDYELSQLLAVNQNNFAVCALGGVGDRLLSVGGGSDEHAFAGTSTC